jgi:hypothetical protein
MSLVRKLKPDRNITGALVPLAMLPIFGLSALAFGLSTGLYILACTMGLWVIYYLYVFIRTRNVAQLVISIYAVFLAYILFVIAKEDNASPFESVEFGLAYFLGLIFFAIVMVYLAVTRRSKWRGREIFELAAEPVDETGNGYTSRPRPVGKVEYSPQQMHQFARFCARHLIALPFTTSKNITLVPIKMGDEFSRLLGLSGDYRDATWINFDIDGEVSVHIAQKDYLDYREPLAFDKLCESLGRLFIEFAEMHQRGEGVRIIDRMDALRLSYFS